MTVIVLVITMWLSTGRVVVSSAIIPPNEDITFCNNAGIAIESEYKGRHLKDEDGEPMNILDVQHDCLTKNKQQSA